MIHFFDPVPSRDEVPARFVIGGVSPLLQRAALSLQTRLAAFESTLGAADGGKMFGVLIVESSDGRIGFLAAFSGMLDGKWLVDGFVPPVFDAVAHAQFWPAGEAALDAMTAHATTLRTCAPYRVALAADEEQRRGTATKLAALVAQHRANREQRRLVRASTTASLDTLAQASRADTAERRRFDAEHAALQAAVALARAPFESELAAIEDARAELSRSLWQRWINSYVLHNARGEARELRALFAPTAPSGGAGDCAAPKLLTYAYRHALRPLALAEFWWGASNGDRRAGTFYPPCRSRCGVILPFMLQGLDVDDRHVQTTIATDEPRVVFEDEWLLVVDKPAGLLAEPGRAVRESLATRVQVRYPHARLAHRLDRDTSGLVLVAKDRETHVALQQMFAARAIDKCYVALLDGVLSDEHGVIELPLRVDLDDRPRQIVDAVHGRAARTEWRVVTRLATQTRVQFWPRTGRTHQLRVHAADARGLDAPIVGDRLYGRAPVDTRLHLHAATLTFTHPRTGRLVAFDSPATF